MQTLVLEIATTFVDDAAALFVGGVRIIIRRLMAPIDRLAESCDVAGLLGQRASAWRAQRKANEVLSARRRCFFSLRCLGDLT
jgi:hypothetical protein